MGSVQVRFEGSMNRISPCQRGWKWGSDLNAGMLVRNHARWFTWFPATSSIFVSSSETKGKPPIWGFPYETNPHQPTRDSFFSLFGTSKGGELHLRSSGTRRGIGDAAAAAQRRGRGAGGRRPADPSVGVECRTRGRGVPFWC